MGKTHLISRMGSKTNDIKFFANLLPKDIKTVVEPFGGSFAVIRDIYNDDKYNKFVNDTDEILFYAYTHPNELIEGLKAWNEINKMVLTTKKKIEKFNELGLNEKINNFIIDTQVVRGCLSNNKNVDDMGEELKLISKINFSNVDAFELIDKFKTDKDAFIFLDPPYLFSNNATYQTQQEQQDMTDYYAKFYDVLKDKKTKAKIMLIINDLKILRWIYKDFLKGDYNRIYQASKKKMKHLIITNYQV